VLKFNSLCANFETWGLQMRRREFIAGLGGAVAWPIVARTQQPVMPLVGLLRVGTGRSLGSSNSPNVAAFLQGLNETGYAPGRNMAFLIRNADSLSLLPMLATDLVERKPAVIVTSASAYAALAAKTATSTIPIVFLISDDPVKYGLVASFSRPGGHLTGVTSLSSDIYGKRLNLLVELVPQAAKIGFLSVSSDSPAFEDSKNEMLAAGRALGREVIVGEVRGDYFEAAFVAFVEQEVQAVIVGDFAAFRDARNRAKILELATRRRIPAIYPDRIYPVDGGLVSYGSSATELLRQVGIYAGRIIKGEKPANLPVVQPTKFELAINLKTAKALELNLPSTLVAIADEVIE
jgi:putative ABC transport system substrate-binding protein